MCFWVFIAGLGWRYWPRVTGDGAGQAIAKGPHCRRDRRAGRHLSDHDSADHAWLLEAGRLRPSRPRRPAARWQATQQLVGGNAEFAAASAGGDHPGQCQGQPVDARGCRPSRRPTGRLPVDADGPIKSVKDPQGQDGRCVFNLATRRHRLPERPACARQTGWSRRTSRWWLSAWARPRSRP